MGIGTIIKNTIGDENSKVSNNGNRSTGTQIPNAHAHALANSSQTKGYDNSFSDTGNNGTGSGNTSGSQNLPAGTGPGTTGKGGAMAGQDLNKNSNASTGGFGTSGSYDSEANSRLNGAAKSDVLRDKPTVPSIGARADHHHHANSDNDQGLGHNHTFGHNNSSVGMPQGEASNDHHQLNPVTHEKVRHTETEEIQRQKEHDRHIHHVQHHTQPVTDQEVMPEKHHENVHPVTRVREKHANSLEDNSLFNRQVRQHRDSVEHARKERNIIDKGTTVNEHEKHHVHHVVQPVINKETTDQHRIHTTIPIHQVTHEAPIVHKNQTHAPVSMDHFSQKGGALSGSVTHDQIGEKVLHGGKCTREVDGEGENLVHDLTGGGI